MIREQDAEEVLTLINRFMNYGSSKNTNSNDSKNITPQKSSKKRVYADTSTGGWY